MSILLTWTPCINACRTFNKSTSSPYFGDPQGDEKFSPCLKSRLTERITNETNGTKPGMVSPVSIWHQLLRSWSWCRSKVFNVLESHPNSRLEANDKGQVPNKLGWEILQSFFLIWKTLLFAPNIQNMSIIKSETSSFFFFKSVLFIREIS